MDDRELLRRYFEDHAEHAFSELVRRHVNLVYTTALRRKFKTGSEPHIGYYEP